MCYSKAEHNKTMCYSEAEHNKTMCYNCGCDNPDDNMGNADNITNSTFEKAAKAWGQTKEDAMKNTLHLLSKKLKNK